MDNYLKQATDFLTSTGTTFKAEFLEHGFHFEGDTETRDIYKITLKRGGREYSFNFGQSINNSGFYIKQGVKITEIDRKFISLSDAQIWSKRFQFNLMPKVGADKIVRPIAPNEYDVLACLTKYDPETFEDFCSEFGYDEDSRKAERVYEGVKDEYYNVAMLWNEEEIEQLHEIS